MRDSLLGLLLDFQWEKDMMLVTLDVSALYSNIPHSKGMENIRDVLALDPLMPVVQKQFLVDSLNFILGHNYFMFNGKFYL